MCEYTYMTNVSFQVGLRVERMVRVLNLTLRFSLNGMRRSLTYGSLRPFGSMGIRLRASNTVLFIMSFLQSYFWYYYDDYKSSP